MNLEQANAVLPLNVLFDEFYKYCQTEPMRKYKNPNRKTLTRNEALSIISSGKTLALLDPTKPRYDVFHEILKTIYNKVVEGQPLCKFNPMFCVWRTNSASIIKDLHSRG